MDGQTETCMPVAHANAGASKNTDRNVQISKITIPVEPNTIFYLITTYTHVRAQSSNFVVLQSVHLYLLRKALHSCGYSFELPWQVANSNEHQQHIEGWAQDYSNSNIFLKPLFRGNLDFVNNANLGAIAQMSNGT